MVTSDEGIIEHYQQVANNTNVGIVIYHYPDATGVELAPELIHEISKIEGIIGIKNTADGIHVPIQLLSRLGNDKLQFQHSYY